MYPFNTRSVSTLAPGERGTDQTIEAMLQLVKSAQHGIADQIAASLLRRYHDRQNAMRALFVLMRAHITFKEDDQVTELLLHPDAMGALLQKAILEGTPFPSDCKKSSTFAAAVLVALGSIPAFIVMKTQGSPTWEHVAAGYAFDAFAEIMPFDPQEATAPGQWPRGVYEAQIYRAS